MVDYEGGMRICHVIGSLRIGGAERQCINLLSSITAKEKYLLVLSREKSGDMEGPTDPDVFKTVRIPVRLRTIVLDILKIARFFRKSDIEVIHTHMFWPSIYGVVAARMAGVPIVFTSEHGLNPWKRQWHYFVERWLLSPLADRRLCVSKDIFHNRVLKDRIPEEKLCVFPNGTVVGEKVQRKRIGNPVRLLAVGRLVDAKDYPVLIRATRILADNGMEFRLHILGDGPLRGHLSKLIDKLCLNDRVILEGGVSDVERWFRSSDVFIMSSKREGQPMVLLEAMAAALPIVATAVGGIPETVKNGEEAILVESGSPASLADAIERLANDSELYRKLSERAYLKVQDGYSIEVLAGRLKVMYEYHLRRRK